MTSEWFFSNWFIHSDSTLPQEPDWLSKEQETPSATADERPTRKSDRRAKRSRSIPRA